MKPLTNCCVSEERTPVLQARVEQAVRAIEQTARTLGYAEMLTVAEELGLEHFVVYDQELFDEGQGAMQFSFSDIQTVAFAAALRARAEYFK